MRKSLLIIFTLAALSGCLGERPTDPEDDAGVGGTMMSAGGSGGKVDAGAHDGGGGGVVGTGGHGMGGAAGSGAAGADAGMGMGGMGTGGAGMGGYAGAAGTGMGGMGMGGAGMGGHAGAAGTGMGGMSMGGAGMGGRGAGGSGTGGTGAGGTVVVPPAALSGSTSKDFAGLTVGTASSAFSWVVSNATGASATGTLSLSNDDPSEVTATGCTGTLAGGASCTVSVTFRPNVPGQRTAHVSVSASPGGSVMLTLTATGQVQVTITNAGTGTVTSTPAGISCPGTCSAAFSASSVTLQARTTNGSNSFFSGWSDPGCPGPFHDCVKSLSTSAVAITATFTAMNANLIFGTLMMYPTNLGGTAPYDAACNSVATSAGLNNTAGNAFIALISDNNSNVISRLGTARGWVRLDGKPFADTQTSLFTSNQIFYPLVFQEDGQPHNGGGFFTGTNADGTAAPANCKNWTSTVNDGTIFSCGTNNGGPGQWIEGNGNSCGGMGPLICMGTTKSAAVTVPAPGTGRKIWLSSGMFIPNSTSTPDALCQGSRPTGVTSAAALIATTKKVASTVLVAGTSYYRVDGTFVGTGASLIAATPISFTNPLPTGIWQSEDGTYPLFNAAAYVGSTSLSTVGTTSSTCGDWADPTQTNSLYGIAQDAAEWWALSTFVSTCNGAGRIYCVQTAP